MTRTALYRHYDADGQLLYVGITDHLSERDKQHAETSHWHGEVKRTETEWCLSRSHAVACEAVAIRYEKPLHNKKMARAQIDTSEGADIASLIDCWPTRQSFAAEISAQTAAVHKWALNGRIPSGWQMLVVEAAQQRGLTSITTEWMVNQHAKIKGAA